MKIGIIIWELNIRGGTQRQALELAYYLKKRGHSVKLYTFNVDFNKCYRQLMEKLNIIEVEDGACKNKIWRLHLIKKIFAPYYSLFRIKQQASQLVKIIDNDFDIINCHDYGNVFVPAIVYKEKYKAPVVWAANDLPMFDTRFRGKGVVKLCQIILGGFRGNWVLKYFRIHCMKKIDSIIVLDHRNCNLVSKHLKCNVFVIRSGLDIGHFSTLKKQMPEYNEFKALTTGIFFYWRRFEDIVEAIKILRQDGLKIKLDIVGSEERARKYAQKIRKLVEDYGLQQQIKFLGHVSEQELLFKYQTSDVFIFPHSPQTWGLAVFEAMACRTPVIVSKGCGASEVLNDGENALLVPPNKPQEIAKKLKNLMQDKQLWKKLSINGRNFVERNISWDLYGKQVEKVFEGIVNRKRR